MHFESSAGGIIFSSLKNALHVLLIKDKNSRWTFPKGLIEKREKPEMTAEREIAEEVGLRQLILIAPLTAIEYFYKWEGTLIKKKVHYYVFNYKGRKKPVPQTEEGIMEVRWVEFIEALKVVGYKKTNVPLLKEARNKLQMLS